MAEDNESGSKDTGNGVTCEVCGKTGFKDQKALNMHQVSAHKKGQKGLGMATTDGGDFKYPPLGDMSILMEIMLKAGVSPGHTQLIQTSFQNYDQDDLLGLFDLLKKAGVPKDGRSLILETWANYLKLNLSEKMKETLGIRGYSGQDGREYDEIKEKADKSVASAEHINDVLETAEKNLMSNLEKRIRMAELVQRAKQFGIALPDELTSMAGSQPHEEKPKLKRHEFPPGSDEYLELSDSDYAEMMLRWNKNQMKQKPTEDEVKDKPKLNKHEFPPGSGVILELTDTDYARLLTEHEAHAKPKTDEQPEWIKTIEKQLDEVKTENQRLREEANQKEREELEGNLNYLNQKNKKLEDQIKNIENQDKLQVISNGYKDVKRYIEDLGFGGNQRTTEDEVLLKKIDNNSQIMAKSFDVIAKKAEQGSKLTGAVAKLIEDRGGDLLNRFLPAKPAGVPTQYYTEDQFAEMNRRFNDQNAKAQENMSFNSQPDANIQTSSTGNDPYGQVINYEKGNPEKEPEQNTDPKKKASLGDKKKSVEEMLSGGDSLTSGSSNSHAKNNKAETDKSPKKSFLCHTCGQTFKTQSQLNMHESTHEKENDNNGD